MNSKKNDVTLIVEGMTCANCALGITHHLQSKGWKNVNVNFAVGEVNIQEVENIHLPEIIKSIEELGYKVNDPSEKKGHQHSHISNLEKKLYFSLTFTIPLMLHMVLPFAFLHHPLVQLFLCVPVFLLGFTYFGKSAWSSLRTGIPNMDVLIVIGIIASFVYSLIGTINYYNTPEVHRYLFYETTATIVSFVLLGNVLEHRSVKQTTSAINDLSKIQPNKAKKVVYKNGKEIIREVDIKDVWVGDTFIVNTGDKIPTDGEIIWGKATLEESMISGESFPIDKTVSDKVIGGTIVVEGNLKMVALKVGKETVLAQIIELVKRAQQSKPNIQRLGDKVSAVFVPVVIGISIVTFIVSYSLLDIPLQNALMRSVAVLVISCPCAMGLATPTAVMVGIGRAAKKGILIKGGHTLEELATIKTVVFDKTGTLTTGKFIIKEIKPTDGISEQSVIDLLYNIEKHSSHPIAKSIAEELKSKASNFILSKVWEEKGFGMRATDDLGNQYYVGSYKGITHITQDSAHATYLSKNEKLLATIDIKDDIKPDAFQVISTLKSLNIKTVLLSGDTRKKCEELAAKLRIDEVYSEQLPHQKIEYIDKLTQKEKTAMIGDGINDAPALTKANVAISLSDATQVAINAAQIILLQPDKLWGIIEAIQMSRHTLKTIKQNLFWAFFYNVLAIPLAAFGFLRPMIAALSMAFSDVIVIGNSIWLKYKKFS